MLKLLSWNVFLEKKVFFFFPAAEQLKLPYLSAYLNSLGANFRHGANFATGGSTIRRPNETIYQYGISPFSLDMQISQFDQFKQRTAELYAKGCFFIPILAISHLNYLHCRFFILGLIPLCVCSKGCFGSEEAAVAGRLLEGVVYLRYRPERSVNGVPAAEQ